jgi:hypothetical protein
MVPIPTPNHQQGIPDAVCVSLIPNNRCAEPAELHGPMVCGSSFNASRNAQLLAHCLSLLVN